MPLRKKLKKIVIIGSGPIVIGQACEFDYSGVQACKALMKLGLEVVLINSNPATIMTDPETASKVYIEPLTFDYVKKVLEKEKPDGLISTLGGQTALNLSLELAERGILKKLGIELLGATEDVIRQVEDRERFITLLDKLACSYAPNAMVKTFQQGLKACEKIGFPIILRPNYTLGGTGGGVAYSLEEYKEKLSKALLESPTSEVLVEKSLLGWKEFELEVMRDYKGTCVIICSIENIDPCGVHTGDSMTVAPQITLSDQAYQQMRLEALKIIKEIGLETGGANIQFAVHPETGERMVIEVNPRVSRSSALASKATGFPIAKISALLAVGFSLDEIKNDITKATPSCYEPALDYIVVKIPCFNFEKYEGTKDLLTTQMQGVGEVMAIGRSFKEAFQKACYSLEKKIPDTSLDFSEEKVTYPSSQRIHYVFEALRKDYSLKALNQLTNIDSWFLDQFQQIIEMEKSLKQKTWSFEIVYKAKRMGFSDDKIAKQWNSTGQKVYQFRKKHKIFPAFYKVDTCAGEFESHTPYYYSTYWASPNSSVKKSPSVLMIGSGPNRIGQGVEFDYNCVRGVKALKKLGYQVSLINSNPETVSTDYDTADQLFFEPLTLEYIREVLNFVQPEQTIVQLGGQTPIKVARDLEQEGFPIAGSSFDTIDLAEDRGRFIKICKKLGFKTPQSSMASCVKEALQVAQNIGYPLLCRPSYVLGGRRMEIIQKDEELKNYFQKYQKFISSEKPCLMDEYLESFLEVDVDMVQGVDWAKIGGIIEHVEAAGVHSGDSMGVLPPQRLKKEVQEQVEELSFKLAKELKILGFLNLQLAIQEDQIYMLEANPRSSRSVPFISKASNIPLVDFGIQAMMKKTKKEVFLDNSSWKTMSHVAVKAVVFPFKKLKNADSLLGPEMKSIGEVMGRSDTYNKALIKALLASHFKLPEKGDIFLSLRNKDKPLILSNLESLKKAGYSFSATRGTAEFLNSHGLDCKMVKKVREGRPHCVDYITSGKVCLVLNTESKQSSIKSSFSIRRSCIDYNIPCLTELHLIKVFIQALLEQDKNNISVEPLL